MTAGQRIAVFRKSLNLTQQQFAEKIGVNRAYLGHIEAGRQEPSFNFVMAIADSYNIKMNWLLTGEGTMYRDAPAADPKLSAMAALLEGLNEEQQREIRDAVAEKKRLNEMSRQIEELQTQLKKLTGT